MSDPNDTPARRLLRKFLVGAVEVVARGVTKGVESIADDAAKTFERERAKIEEWRKRELGEIECVVISRETEAGTSSEEARSDKHGAS